MRKHISLLPVLLFLAGCSMAYLQHEAPFPRASVVAEYTMPELREKVLAQEETRLHPPAAHMMTLKHYPTPDEFRELEGVCTSGDKLVEFHNDDWFVDSGTDRKSAERAFCLVHAGRIVKTVKIWSTEE